MVLGSRRGDESLTPWSSSSAIGRASSGSCWKRGGAIPSASSSRASSAFHAAHRAPSRARRRHHGTNDCAPVPRHELWARRHLSSSARIRQHSVPGSSRHLSGVAPEFSTTCSKRLRQSLAKMIYAITCFAALSFVGTVLGGPTLGDQSWGGSGVGRTRRKNGRSSSLIWEWLHLHARWGGMRARARLQTSRLRQHRTSGLSARTCSESGPATAYGFMEPGNAWTMIAFRRQPSARYRVGRLLYVYGRVSRRAAPTAPTETAGGGFCLRCRRC